MISLDNVTVRFGGRTLFESVSLMFNDKERLGLVGRNGTGKTTLLKILAGMQEPSEGKLTRTGDLTIGYLPQQMTHLDGKTVYNETLTAFDTILNIEREIHELNILISKSKDYESSSYLKMIDRLHHLNEELVLNGANSLEAEIEKTLCGLGFKKSDFNRNISEFSGGWRMRIELAKLLLRKPDFLLLDEPTNHLDIDSIEWLETYLSSYNGGVLLISHDRVLLDNICRRIIELRAGKVYDYNVPYSQFIELKEERMIQQMSAFQNQQKMIRDTEKFIERFRYKATKAIQVQSRIKQLNKLERIEIEEDDPGFLNIKFPEAPRSSSIVVEAADLSKSYGNSLVLNKVNILIERGEKLAFVGKNGEGKTTLSKIIVGEIDYEGSLKIGQNLSIGYFAQNQDELLDDNLTVFETIDLVAVGEIRTKIRSILGAFLFSGEDSEKKVKVLSGGERSRLSLAKLLLQPNNLLVLDEPTNHLDMRSKDILKNALIDYSGTLIVVSHDREFLDGLVDKVYEFKNHKVKEHTGGIFEFLERRKIASLKELERKTDLKSKNDKKESGPSPNKIEYFKRKEFDRELRKLKNQLSELESEITNLEKKIMEIEDILSAPENIQDSNLFKEYSNVKHEHDKLLEHWEKLHVKLEDFENIK